MTGQAFKDQTKIFNIEKDFWDEIGLVHVTMECDRLDNNNGKSVECSSCGRTGLTSDVWRQKDKDEDKSKPNKKEGCTRCGRGGYLVAECYATCHKDGTVLEKAAKSETQTTAQNHNEELMEAHYNLTTSPKFVIDADQKAI